VSSGPQGPQGAGSRWTTTPAGREFVAAWVILAALGFSAVFLHDFAGYRVILAALAAAGAVVSFRDIRTAAVMVVGAPVLDVYGIVLDAPQVVTVFQVVLIASLAGIGWRLLRGRAPGPLRLSVWDASLGLLVVGAGLSILLSYAVMRSIVGFVEVAFLLGMYFTVSRASAERPALDAVVTTVVVGGTLSAALAVGQTFVSRFPVPPMTLFATGETVVAYRATALFGNPNTLAILLVLAALLAVERGVKADHAVETVSYALAAALCAIGIALTLSREAYVGLAVGLLVLVVVAAPRLRSAIAWLAAAAILVAALALIPGVGSRAGSIVAFRGDSSAMDRIYLSGASARMFQQHPLTGVGISAFSAAYPAYADARVTVSPVTDGHQMPFSVPAELGVLGLLAEVALACSLVFLAARSRVLFRDHRVSVGAVAACVAFAVMSAFNTFLFFESFWTALGLTGAVFLVEPYGILLAGPARPLGVAAGEPEGAAGEHGPLVSVLTPSFGQAEWLGDNLRSVACQTYPNIEHIVMDGGSSDGSVEILREVGDAISWRSEPDRGQSDAINKAFSLSSGEIIGWINSDDAYFDCDVVADVVTYFVAHPEVDVVFGHAAQIAEDGTIIWMIWVPRYSRRLLKVVNFIGQPVAFIRRSALSEPMLDESYDFAMDYELWLRLANEGARFHRLDRITAVDRHQRGRKGVTISHVLHSDIARLAETHGRGYPRGKRVLSCGFYTWRRAMGALLVPRIPAKLAFTETFTPKWDVFRRQVLSWGRKWPEDWDPRRPGTDY
jgi:glycosyltransferase involved in cell wall biosynthesis